MMKILKTPERNFDLDSDDSFAIKSARNTILKKNVSAIIDGLREKNERTIHENQTDQSKDIKDQSFKHDGINASADKYMDHSNASLFDNVNYDDGESINYEKSVFLKEDSDNTTFRSKAYKFVMTARSTAIFFVKKYFLICAISLLVAIVAVNVGRINKPPKYAYEKDISRLHEQNENLKKIIKKITSSRFATREVNICKIEKGTTIDCDKSAKPYRYGIIFRRSGRHIHCVMSDNVDIGECFAMRGCQGKIVFNFSKKYKIHKIGVFHPHGSKMNSSIKNFQVVGMADGKEVASDMFLYKDTGNYQEFYLKEKNDLDSLHFNVLSNHGNRSYTCIYKIFIFIEETL